LLGEGDVMAVAPPNHGINLRGPSSPIFSSVLKIRFRSEIDLIPSGFRMTLDDHWRLFDGFDVELRNGSGDRANVHPLTMFRRPSDPYAAVLSPAGKTLYIADAARESVVKVDTETGPVAARRALPAVGSADRQRHEPAGQRAERHLLARRPASGQLSVGWSLPARRGFGPGREPCHR
jgi:hypothetical protein